MLMRRPNPVQWIRYTYGGRLPDRYRQWVLHDTTSRTWLLRFVVRIIVEALPWLVAGFLVLTLLTPLPVAAAVAAAGLALLMSLYFTVTSADELSEARLVKHGYPPGTGKATRRRRTGSSWG
jgi:undecaprenyl pyrophosphate phosphatase UppP